jgi:acyl carrier protein
MTPAVPGELTGLIAQNLDVDAGLVTPQARFVDLGRTSLAEVELLTALESHYDITLDFERYLGLQTVGELADALAAAVRDKHAQTLAGQS